jgi:hypothetical protein
VGYLSRPSLSSSFSRFFNHSALHPRPTSPSKAKSNPTRSGSALTLEEGALPFIHCYETNVFGPVKVTNAIVPYMRSGSGSGSGSDGKGRGRGGTILFVGSRSAWKTGAPVSSDLSFLPSPRPQSPSPSSHSLSHPSHYLSPYPTPFIASTFFRVSSYSRIIPITSSSNTT